MSVVNLERRIARIETTAMPAPLQSVRLMSEPPDNAPPEVRAQHLADLSAAEAIGEFVIVLTALRKEKP